MGTNNRARRAAKQRKRQERSRVPENGQRSAAPPPADGEPCDCLTCAPPTSESLQRAFVEAAYACTDGTGYLDARAEALAHPRLDQRLVDLAAESCLTHAIRTVWERGWQPRDASELASRRLTAAQRALLIDAIAAEARRYAASTVDPRWTRQLAEIGASVWWPPDRPHLSQWGTRHRHERRTTIAAAIGVLGFCLNLPRAVPVLPLPGSARVAVPRVRRGNVDEKMLARIRALLAKAESTDFPEEAEALSSKAQELMTRFSLDRALVDAGPHQPGPHKAGGGNAQAGARRIWLDPPYVAAKSLLVQAVANANHCRLVTDAKTGYVTVVGPHVDLELVEILTTSLLLQASRAMLAPGSQVGRYGRSRTRSWRQSFLVSYSTRIGERLSEASAATQASVGEQTSARLLPVLAAREREVESLFTELFPRTISRSISVSNGDGWAAGRAAADLARLDARQALSG